MTDTFSKKREVLKRPTDFILFTASTMAVRGEDNGESERQDGNGDVWGRRAAFCSDVAEASYDPDGAEDVENSDCN